jgi:dihydroxyacetone kinase-like protein
MEADTAVNIKASDIAALIRHAHAIIDAHAQELTELDAAIGDADHGLNMKRGFEALLAESDALAQKPFGEALKSAGMKLVMTVGGASGPLYGTFLMTLGKEIDAAPFDEAFTRAVNSVAARGKSERGQKTMLDVLFPLAEAVQAGTAAGELPAIAENAAQAMVPVQATRGRASFLGERSMGHMDPGSRSCVLLTHATVKWLEAKGPEGSA